MSDNPRNLVPRVSVGQHSTLFLVGGTNAAIELYSPELFANQIPLARWNQRLSFRTTFFRERGIAWRMVLSPEKLSIYGQDELNRWIPGPTELPGKAFMRLTGSHRNIIYPITPLIDAVDQGRIYPKTDSHWSSLAASIAFSEFCSSLQLQIDKSVFSSEPEIALHYYGDLWDPEFTEIPKDTFIRRKIASTVRTIYTNPLMGLKSNPALENEPGLHVGSHVIWANEAAPIGSRLLLFGSSFSECRLDCSLLSYMAVHAFQEVHFIWSTSLDLDYIERNKPDLVLIEMPERFLTKCPNDDFSVEAFGAQTARDWTERHCNAKT